MTNFILIIFHLIPFLSFTSSYGMCGTPKVPMASDSNKIGGARIVGGNRAHPNSHPWIVSLSKGGVHFCGGSLIRVSEEEETDIVLTAAHCVYDYENKRSKVAGTKVTAGAHVLSSDPMSGQQTVSAKVAFVHDSNIFYGEYGLSTFDDMAILLLASPITFNSAVQPVCLPFPDELVQPDTDLILAGWGRISDKGPKADILQQVTLTVHSDETCVNASKNILDDMMICVGGKRKREGPCYGDSGGPGVEKQEDKYVIQGVANFVIGGCGNPNHPSVYTRVSSYIRWIYNQVKEHSAVYKRNPKLGDSGFLAGIPECGPGSYSEPFPGGSSRINNVAYCSSGRHFLY